jgi:hypothetical protein
MVMCWVACLLVVVVVAAAAAAVGLGADSVLSVGLLLKLTSFILV